MSDLIDQTGLTFGEHLLALAEAVGTARTIDDSGNPLPDAATIEDRLPDDPVELDMLKRTFNAGYASFCTGADPLSRPGRAPYTNWTFLTRTVSVYLNRAGDGPQNIDGDNARYRLPSTIRSRPKSSWIIEIPGVLGSRVVEDTTSQRVATLLASLAVNSSTSGYPYMAACRPIDAPEGEGEGQAWEVIVAPRPTQTATMTAQFTLTARRLRGLDEKHICGAQHDPALRAFAVMEWYRRDVEHTEKFARAVADAASKLDASVDMDKQMGPRIAGLIHDPGIGRHLLTRDDTRRRSGVVLNQMGTQ